MKIHILGVCGAFMGSLALLAAKAGYQVSGQDNNVYPPMSTQLSEHGIEITDGYALTDLPQDAELIVIGNVMRRGMDIVEHILARRLAYMSGPEFLARYILRHKHVLVVSGTHGKTTTASLLAWILEYAGLQPGFLIGGVPNNFAVSARLSNSKYFVIEGDEYDCAFFDKRSKFLHYQPSTLIINNIEYDHADIFKDLAAILTQFNHLLRILPANGLLVYNGLDENIANLLSQGCWSQTTDFASAGAAWAPQLLADIKLPISLSGTHNLHNALAALAAAQHVGVELAVGLAALQEFTGVKRRLELKGVQQQITVYNDFAHHPTAIATTIAGVRSLLRPEQRLLVVVDLCSNTMKSGIHADKLPASVAAADQVFFYHATDLTWDVVQMWRASNKPGGVYSDQPQLLQAMQSVLQPQDTVLLMSNGAFVTFADLLLQALAGVMEDALVSSKE